MKTKEKDKAEMKVETQERSIGYWVCEIWRMIKLFFVRINVYDPIFEIPDSIKKSGSKIGRRQIWLTIVGLFFPFLLQITNDEVENGKLILALGCFGFYKLEPLLTQAISNRLNLENDPFNQMMIEESGELGFKILPKVVNKVFKYDDKKLNMSKVLDNNKLVEVIKNYITLYWRYRIMHKFELLELVSVMVMLRFAIKTNSKIPNVLFIPFVLVFVAFSFLLAAYKVINKKDCWDKEREYIVEQGNLYQDMVRVPNIIPDDMNLRICKFKEVNQKNRDNQKNMTKKLNQAAIWNVLLELLFQFFIIVFYIKGIKDFSAVNKGTVSDLIAILGVLMTALNHVKDLASKFSDNSDRIEKMEREVKDLQLIMDVYHYENMKTVQSKPIVNIEIQKFEVMYEKKDEDDIPFRLVSNSILVFNRSDVVILYGSSGTGKSTFMKLITQRVKLQKTCEIPDTDRYLYFDEQLKFGSLSIYEEFFVQKAIDYDRAYEIFDSFHFIYELKLSRETFLNWMKKSKYDSLSHGQQQRMILAKILYHLNSKVDVLVLDEVTSGLDNTSDKDVNAQEILEFVVRYANRDKKRIVIIATHQNIDEFKSNLAGEYNFKELYFTRRQDYSEIIQNNNYYI